MSAARTFAWEFRTRHRWGLRALGAYLVAMAAVKLWVLTTGLRVNLDSPRNFALVVVVPMSATFTYCLALFSYGYAGDLAGRGSIYPARLFTLPVRTSELARWPMLFGAIAMMLLWAATRTLALWPADVPPPTVWPALLAASLLAWTQAIAWMPYPLRGLRVAAFVAWLFVVDTIVLLALHFQARETTMLLILAPHVPLAYLVARYALRRARSGDVPDWSSAFANVLRLRSAARREFRSAAGAQLWFEWQQYGRSLPILVAIVLPFELLTLRAARGSTVLVSTIAIGVLITPPFMAAFTAATVSRSPSGDARGLATFTAARPVSGASLVSAKLAATLLSTLLAWTLVLIALPIGLRWSGTWPVIAERAHRTVLVFGVARSIVLGTCLVLVCITSTWKQLVQSLYIGLTGREWLIKGSVFATLAVIAVLGPVLQWIADHPPAQRALWDASLTWLPMALVVVKLALGSWVAVCVHRARLLSDRALLTLAMSWLATVLLIHAMLLWFADTDFVPHYLLLCLAVLFVPLVRVCAAPLALAWNRHR